MNGAEVVARLLAGASAESVSVTGLASPWADGARVLVSANGRGRVGAFEDWLASLPDGERVRVRTEVEAAADDLLFDGADRDSADSATGGPDALMADSWLPLAKIIAAFQRGETGDAEILACLFSGRVAFDHSENAWHLWAGHHWQRDQRAQVVRLVSNQVAAQYLHAAAEKVRLGASQDDPEIAKLRERAGSLRGRARIANVLTLAQSQPELGLTGNEWDADPWLLGAANGVINLHDGSFRAGLPADLIRTAAPTEWRGLDAPAPRFERFILEIFNGDRSLADFMRRLLGYGITGLSSEHVLPVLWGQGWNGKDTLLEALRETLGEGLAGPVAAEILTERERSPNGATPNLYALRGLRLAWVNETNEGARLNAGQVKLLTGGGTVTARPLYGRPVRFAPQHLLMLVTNHRPHASADDYALWKRLLLVPFTLSFVDNPTAEHERQRDPALRDKLLAERPGILAWLVRGCLEWQAQGLNPPTAVLAATQQYRTDEDDIADFLAEECVIAPHAFVKAGDLYSAYDGWARRGGIRKPMAVTTFGKRMKTRFRCEDRRDGRHYLGVGLAAKQSGAP